MIIWTNQYQKVNKIAEISWHTHNYCQFTPNWCPGSSCSLASQSQPIYTGVAPGLWDYTQLITAAGCFNRSMWNGTENFIFRVSIGVPTSHHNAHTLTGIHFSHNQFSRLRTAPNIQSTAFSLNCICWNFTIPCLHPSKGHHTGICNHQQVILVGYFLSIVIVVMGTLPCNWAALQGWYCSSCRCYNTCDVEQLTKTSSFFKGSIAWRSHHHKYSPSSVPLALFSMWALPELLNCKIYTHCNFVIINRVDCCTHPQSVFLVLYTRDQD